MDEFDFFHVHSKVTTDVEPYTAWNSDEVLGYGWIATCGACGEKSDHCDTAAIARRNLALTNYGGVRP